jgi:hypothetical protein
VHDEGVWLNATVMGEVKGPPVFFAEGSRGIKDGVSHQPPVLLRPTIGYRLSDEVPSTSAMRA